MAFDREASLKRAEKLLRQGRLDAAIEEYLHLLEEVPNDWNSRNALGDLYVRGRKIDEAAAQFARIADHFAHEGFLPRAVALYKKVIKIKPDDEHALLQSAEVNTQQRLLVEAKACLAAVVEHRRRKGDNPGANEIVIKIAAVDPSDLTARLNAARAAAETGDADGAATRFKELASDLFERDRPSEAIDALAQAIQLAPSDADARNALVAAYLQRDDTSEARRHATTASHFKAVAEALIGRGQEDEAVDVLAEAVQHDPSDVATRVSLVRHLLARGQTERASEFVGSDALGDDADLMLLAAEVDLRAGRRDAGRELLHSLIECDYARHAAVVALGETLAQTDADAAFVCFDVATDAMAAVGGWPAAAGALHGFTRVVPLHIPALMKLVDLCVDGDLREPLFAAEAQLAEAYLAAGRSFEARVIAEDLVAREPGDPANVDRFRRALVLAGEPDPDAVIADRLSCDALLLEDLNADVPPQGIEVGPLAAAANEPAETQAACGETAVSAIAGHGEVGVAPALSFPDGNGRSSGEGAGLVLSMIAEREAQAAADGATGAIGEFDEIDLSGALGDIDAGQTSQPDLASPETPVPGGELDEVFEEFRQEVLREQVSSVAGQHYKLALTYHDMGMTEECMKALEVASRSPRYRFHAAVLLARLYRHQGKRQHAIDWFERAAETPAPSVDASRALLYELGRTLEDEGESVRALAVFLELEAEAGGYRDVGTRIKALSS